MLHCSLSIMLPSSTRTVHLVTSFTWSDTHSSSQAFRLFASTLAILYAASQHRPLDTNQHNSIRAELID